MRIEEIMAIIKDVEDFKRELDDSSDPGYYEREFVDGEKEIYAEFPVDGTPELTVVFAEQDHIKEMRDKEYAEEITVEEFEEYMQSLNEINDQFDFDNVVGYRINNGQIEWLK